MLHTITLSDSVFALLIREAELARLSPNQLAEKLLAEKLSAERQAWQFAFENLLSRVHQRMAAFDSAEIEADITAAAEEVKAERRVRRRSA